MTARTDPTRRIARCDVHGSWIDTATGCPECRGFGTREAELLRSLPCALCQTSPSLAYGWFCARCDELWTAPAVVDCLEPLRCYCPAHRPASAELVAAVRQESAR